MATPDDEPLRRPESDQNRDDRGVFYEKYRAGYERMELLGNQTSVEAQLDVALTPIASSGWNLFFGGHNLNPRFSEVESMAQLADLTVDSMSFGAVAKRFGFNELDDDQNTIELRGRARAELDSALSTLDAAERFVVFGSDYIARLSDAGVTASVIKSRHQDYPEAIHYGTLMTSMGFFVPESETLPKVDRLKKMCETVGVGQTAENAAYLDSIRLGLMICEARKLWKEVGRGKAINEKGVKLPSFAGGEVESGKMTRAEEYIIKKLEERFGYKVPRIEIDMAIPNFIAMRDSHTEIAKSSLFNKASSSYRELSAATRLALVTQLVEGEFTILSATREVKPTGRKVSGIEVLKMKTTFNPTKWNDDLKIAYPASYQREEIHTKGRAFGFEIRAIPCLTVSMEDSMAFKISKSDGTDSRSVTLRQIVEPDETIGWRGVPEAFLPWGGTTRLGGDGMAELIESWDAGVVKDYLDHKYGSPSNWSEWNSTVNVISEEGTTKRHAGEKFGGDIQEMFISAMDSGVGEMAKKMASVGAWRELKKKTQISTGLAAASKGDFKYAKKDYDTFKETAKEGDLFLAWTRAAIFGAFLRGIKPGSLEGKVSDGWPMIGSKPIDLEGWRNLARQSGFILYDNKDMTMTGGMGEAQTRLINKIVNGNLDTLPCDEDVGMVSVEMWNRWVRLGLVDTA